MGRELGVGDAYANLILGVEEETEVDDGREVYEKALRALRARGVHAPTYEQLCGALVEASS